MSDDLIEFVAKALTERFEKSHWRVFDDGQAEDLAVTALEAIAAYAALKGEPAVSNS